MSRLFEDMLETFNEEFGRLPAWWGDGRFMPALDVTEDESSMTLVAEVPGMSRDDLEVTVEDGVLALRGEKKEEQVSEGAHFRRAGRRFGSFERRIHLPEHVDSEKIEATYKDGVLKLRMPKLETVKPKAIPIKTE
jgi:HSP20 family protein